jgi:hypothetical protein
MEAGWHKPRFNLSQVAVLILAIAVVLAFLPVPESLFGGGLVLVLGIIRSMTSRTKLIEWVVLAAIVFVLFELLLPPVEAHGSRRIRLPTGQSQLRPEPPTLPGSMSLVR